MNKENTDLEVNSTSPEQECIVEVCADNLSITETALSPNEEVEELKILKKATGNVAVPKATQSLSNKKNRCFEVTVKYKLVALDVAVDWGEPSNKVKLTAHDPSGKEHGSYDDKSNGKKDGKISIRIKNPQIGPWKFEVSGLSSNGSKNCTFRSFELK